MIKQLTQENSAGALESKEKNSQTGLPEYFSWENYLNTAVDQGACGSCFAISTAGMLSARFKIKVKIIT